MTEIPVVYIETLREIDARCYGPYVFGWCTLAEELDLPMEVNRYNPDDYTNPDEEWIEAMADAKRMFAEKLRLLRQQREWEEGVMWEEHEDYGDSGDIEPY